MTINTNQKIIGTVSELKQNKLQFEVGTVTYKLLKAMDVFLISVCTEKESSTAFAGNDFRIANEIFETVVSGAVTPCTAEDVCRDLLGEK